MSGARWCSAAWRARALYPLWGWWHPYLARAVCSVRFEFTTLLGRKIYGALLKAIQTRTGPFETSFGSMARFATRFACANKDSYCRHPSIHSFYLRHLFRSLHPHFFRPRYNPFTLRHYCYVSFYYSAACESSTVFEKLDRPVC